MRCISPWFGQSPYQASLARRQYRWRPDFRHRNVALGFLPGTCAAAFGEGRLDGLFRGVFGIFIGAGYLLGSYPFIQNDLLKLGDYGKLTLPTVLDVDPWIVIGPFAVIVMAILWGMKSSRSAG